MPKIADLIRTDDFKKEKHVPVVEITQKGQPGDPVEIMVSVGKEIAHPNTTAHFIDWITLYYLPEGGKFVYCLGRAEFSAHGASTEGPDSIVANTEPVACFKVKLDQPGTLMATSYCNIHGAWEGQAELSW